MDALNIHTIIDGCRANNQAAREMLFYQVYDYALPIAQRYARTDSEAREQVEQVYLEILENLSQYEPHQINFKSWVKQLLLNRCITQVKARCNARQAQEPGLTQDWYYLYRIRQLTPIQQGVLNLHDQEGYSFKEIAAMFSIDVAACEQEYHKATAIIIAPVPGLPSPLSPLPYRSDRDQVFAAWDHIAGMVREHFPGEQTGEPAVEPEAGVVVPERSWLGWALLIGLFSGCLILFSSMHLVSPLRIKVKSAPVNYFQLPQKK